MGREVSCGKGTHVHYKDSFEGKVHLEHVLFI